MNFTYLFLFLIFLADVVWVVVHIFRSMKSSSGEEDDEGGVLEDFDPVLDLPPGVTLPSGPRGHDPYQDNPHTDKPHIQSLEEAMVPC